MSETLSSAVHLAVAFNNTGAELVAAGNFDGAISAFTAALRASKRMLICQDRSKMLCSEECDLDDFIEIIDTPDAVDSEDVANAIHPIDSKFLIRHPIRIRTTEMTQHKMQNCIALLCEIALFNLAMTHHLSATVMETTNDPRLVTAVQLYKLALDLTRASPKRSSGGVFVSMAILNNLAHAHSWLGNQQVSKQYSGQLLSTLALLSIDARRSNSTNLQHVFYQRFLRFIFPGGRHGAAAA